MCKFKAELRQIRYLQYVITGRCLYHYHMSHSRWIWQTPPCLKRMKPFRHCKSRTPDSLRKNYSSERRTHNPTRMLLPKLDGSSLTLSFVPLLCLLLGDLSNYSLGFMLCPRKELKNNVTTEDETGKQMRGHSSNCTLYLHPMYSLCQHELT
jgi:hypothetical protein